MMLALHFLLALILSLALRRMLVKTFQSSQKDRLRCSSLFDPTVENISSHHLFLASKLLRAFLLKPVCTYQSSSHVAPYTVDNSALNKYYCFALKTAANMCLYTNLSVRQLIFTLRNHVMQHNHNIINPFLQRTARGPRFLHIRLCCRS